MDIGFQEFQKGLAFGIMSEWPILRSDGGDFGMSMHSRGFVRSPRCAACSVIRKRESSPSNGAQKNDLQLLWSSALGLVRPTHTARSRSVVWRRAHLSGHRGASGAVQELRAREARLGEKRTRSIRLAVMDMWKPFHNVTAARAPQAAILYDKFHVMRHLGDALDEVRKCEYRRLSGQDRSYIKGQKYTLLSRRENLTLKGRQALKKVLMANKRLNTAYLLRESFGQLWDYEREGWARRFFENWRASLKWQRLKPYEKFAEMIDRHWDGIAAYCRPENKVSLGFVEGLNNKIRVIQRRAYGLHDEEYLRLKVLTCMLPQL